MFDFIINKKISIDNKPVVVKVNMAILSITEISEVKMVRLIFYFFPYYLYQASLSSKVGLFISKVGESRLFSSYLFIHIPIFIYIEYFLRLIEKLLLKILWMC